jgi:glycosyltransferase involved in cell wall biosynthesis
MGVPVMSVAGRGGRLGRIARIVKELQRNPADLLQSQHFFANAYATVAARLAGVLEIGAVRNDGYSEAEGVGAVGRFLSLNAPRILAANSRAGMRAAGLLGAPAERLYFLPNVVDTARFAPRDSGKRNGIRLLAAANLVPRKRLDRFLNILARVRIQCGPAVTGIIAGSGPLRKELVARAAELRLYPEAVDFRDSVTDMTAIYHEADILLLTSEFEGTPNAILEAMSSGLPVVATDVGGVGDLVRDGTTGYLVPRSYDEDLIVNRTVSLVRDSAARSGMGREGRAEMERSYALTRLGRILSDFYTAVLNSHLPYRRAYPRPDALLGAPACLANPANAVEQPRRRR